MPESNGKLASLAQEGDYHLNVSVTFSLSLWLWSVTYQGVCYAFVGRNIGWSHLYIYYLTSVEERLTKIDLKLDRFSLLSFHM